MATQSGGHRANKTARLGYVLWQAGFLSTFVYPIESGVAKWRYFNIFVELGIIGVAVLGIVVMRHARLTKLRYDKALIVSQALTSAGMGLLASGLAFAESMTGTALVLVTFSVGPLLFATGIVVSTLRINTAY